MSSRHSHEPITSPTEGVDTEKGQAPAEHVGAPEKSSEGAEGEPAVTGTRLALVSVAILMAFFLVALDRTIIGVAIPAITNDFHALNDIGWYASAYLITICTTQLMWGRIFTFYQTKSLLVIAIVIFEIGSVVCGAAPSSVVLIMGRAIAGIGAAGIFSGSVVVMTEIVPLPKRPMYIGFLGSVFGVSSIVGPLLGGAFTDHVSWRWCFYINLPMGAVATAILMLLLKPAKKPIEHLPLTRQLARLDPAGTTVLVPGIVCLVLALQWGDLEYAWNDGRIITLLVITAFLLAAFVGIQVWRKEDATIPPRIMMQRSVFFGAVAAILIGGVLIASTVYLPLWFQAIKGTTATQSGIDTIPLVLALVAASILTGIATSKTGHYMPWMYVSVVLCSVGAGLMTTFDVDTSQPKWIGYQVLFGFGLGCGMQKSSLAAQTLGGSIIVAIAQSLFINDLSDRLPHIAGIDIAAILSGGATELVMNVSTEKLPQVLREYNESIMLAFYVVVVTSAITVLPCLGMEWKSVKKAKPEATVE